MKHHEQLMLAIRWRRGLAESPDWDQRLYDEWRRSALESAADALIATWAGEKKALAAAQEYNHAALDEATRIAQENGEYD